MKLIIISHEPFRSFMRENYLMDQFEKDGYTVEFWAINNILNYTKSVIYSKIDLNKDVVCFETDSDFKKNLHAVDKSSIVCLELLFNWDTLWIYKTLREKKVKVFALDYYLNYPEPSKVNRVLKAIHQKRIKDLITFSALLANSLLLKCFTKISRIQRETLKFVPGARSIMLGNNIIPMNHFDYYSHIRLINEPPYLNFKYVVFLDIDITAHPDLTRHKRKTIDSETYFFKMNRFFDNIENELDCKVVIAAHPKSNYTSQFKDRACIYNQTANLVSNAYLVLTHHSMSLNFAILAKKPILLLYTEDFISTKKPIMFLNDVYDSMIGFQKLLDCSLINIDSAFKTTYVKPINEAFYDTFINDYILSPKGKDNYLIVKLGIEGI